MALSRIVPVSAIVMTIRHGAVVPCLPGLSKTWAAEGLCPLSVLLFRLVRPDSLTSLQARANNAPSAC